MNKWTAPASDQFGEFSNKFEKIPTGLFTEERMWLVRKFEVGVMFWKGLFAVKLSPFTIWKFYKLFRSKVCYCWFINPKLRELCWKSSFNMHGLKNAFFIQESSLSIILVLLQFFTLIEDESRHRLRSFNFRRLRFPAWTVNFNPHTNSFELLKAQHIFRPREALMLRPSIGSRSGRWNIYFI